MYIEQWKYIADYHTHTCFSHGRGTVDDNVRAALARGLTTIGIADHGPANWWNVGIKRIADFERLIEEVWRARRRFPEIQILAGVEANIISYDGELDVPEAVQEQLDQVLVGFHTMIIPKSWGDGLRFIRLSLAARLGERRFSEAKRAHTQALIAAIQRYRIFAVTHPGLRIAIDSEALAKVCAMRQTALEINARQGLASPELIRHAAGCGVRFILSSDAHRPEEVGRLEPAEAAARAAGLTVEQIINVRELPEA